MRAQNYVLLLGSSANGSGACSFSLVKLHQMCKQTCDGSGGKMSHAPDHADINTVEDRVTTLLLPLL